MYGKCGLKSTKYGSKQGECTYKSLELQPSLASLGDDLQDSAGSQRDEAKQQPPVLDPGLEPRTNAQQPEINS